MALKTGRAVIPLTAGLGIDAVSSFTNEAIGSAVILPCTMHRRTTNPG